MLTLKLITKEILHRKAHFILGLLAVVTAVAMYVTFTMIADASERETAKIMLTSGFNIRIIPKDTDLGKFLNDGFSEQTMPAEYLDKIASQKGFSYNHLLATLQKKITWRDTDIRLTGLAPEVCPPDRKKPPMPFSIKDDNAGVFSIKEGTAYVGFLLAQKFAIKKGDPLEINGTTLTVADTLAESGTVDDIRIQTHIADAQKILDLPNRINEIQAVDCLCFVPTDDPVAILRSELAKLLPDAQVIQMKKLADARTKQRQMVRENRAFIMTFVTSMKYSAL